MILGLPSTKLYGLSVSCKSSRLLFNAYYNEFKYPQFRTTLDYQFYNYFLPKLNDILTKGFSPEIIACKSHLDALVEKLVGENSSALEKLGRSL